MVELSKNEKRLLSKFFAENKVFLETRDLNDLYSLKEFIELYGKFLEENNLFSSRALTMFLVELKEEYINAKFRKSASSFNTRSIDFGVGASKLLKKGNPTINAWKSVCISEQSEKQEVFYPSELLERRLKERDIQLNKSLK